MNSFSFPFDGKSSDKEDGTKQKVQGNILWNHIIIARRVGMLQEELQH